MYSCWSSGGLNYVLQPSHQAHLIISYFSGRGSFICQTWEGLLLADQVQWGQSKYHDSSNVSWIQNHQDLIILYVDISYTISFQPCCTRGLWFIDHLLSVVGLYYLVVAHLFLVNCCQNFNFVCWLSLIGWWSMVVGIWYLFIDRLLLVVGLRCSIVAHMSSVICWWLLVVSSCSSDISPI